MDGNTTARHPPHGHELRKGRYSIPNRVYLITAVTAERAPVFAEFAAARAAVRGLRDAGVARLAETLAFVVMPDHVHWLLQLTERGTLPAAVRLYKAKVSVMLGRKVWQRGFHDHALRREEDLRTVARYVVANPLRAGLAENVGDYPHWDAVWL